MKHLNVLLFNLLPLFIITPLYSQCDSIVLKNQQEVNQFISKFGRCTEVNHLIIKDVDADIFQLDSLYLIERVNGELELNFKGTNQNIKNISGLKSLKYANLFSLFTYKLDGKLINLDKVDELILSNNGEPQIEILSMFPNLKTIESRLQISNNITEKNTPFFKTGENFTLWLAGQIDSISLQVLSSRIKIINLKNLFLFPTEGLSLKNLTILDSVENLHLSYCKNSNFGQISTIKNLKTLTLENDLGHNDYGEGLQNVDFLKTLWLSNNNFNLDYRKILPNLKSIDERLFISNQDSLANLNILDNVASPQDSSQFFTIVIQNNRRLIDCNTPFLCEALARYPNSVIIQNNAGKCTKEEIIKYCKIVNTSDTNKRQILISPNPTNGNLKIDNLQLPAMVTISNINGQIVKQFNNVLDEVNVFDLHQGIYILDIRSKEISERHKIVKVE